MAYKMDYKKYAEILIVVIIGFYIIKHYLPDLAATLEL